MSRQVVGILGGMGPKATVIFMDKIIQKTPAQKDQDHLRMLVDNNPLVPDRTEAILFGGESPVSELQSMAKSLEQMGADFIVMPCNTAHYFSQEIISVINIPFINMIDITVKYIKEMKSNAKNMTNRVGLLATTGTIKSQIYHNALSSFGLELLTPSPYQEQVMEGIYAVKRGDLSMSAVQQLEDPIHYLEDQEADILIMGCTEIPILINKNTKYKNRFNANLLDPTDILAEATIKRALQISAL